MNMALQLIFSSWIAEQLFSTSASMFFCSRWLNRFIHLWRISVWGFPPRSWTVCCYPLNHNYEHLRLEKAIRSKFHSFQKGAKVGFHAFFRAYPAWKIDAFPMKEEIFITMFFFLQGRLGLAVLFPPSVKSCRLWCWLSEHNIQNIRIRNVPWWN